MGELKPANDIAGPVLKDQRAYWLYQVPIMGLTLLPLLVVAGLVLTSWAGVTVSETVIAILGSLAAASLGGLVNMITTGGTNAKQQ